MGARPQCSAGRTPHWPLVAGMALAGSALLLWRSDPLPWFAPLPVLLVCPWLGRWRLSLALGLLLLSWMAWRYDQLWQQRLAADTGPVALRGTVQGPVRAVGEGFRFAFLPRDTAVGRLRVSWYRSDAAPQAGQCWAFDLALKAPRGSANPGDFDYEAWLFREGYAGRASVRGARACGPSPPETWRDRARQRWQTLGSPRASATLAALLLGERGGMTDADWTVLRQTGTSHLFAISGLHLGLVAGVAYALGVLLWRMALWRWLPRSADVGAVLAALAAVVYAAISGFGVPVQRALIMCLLGLLLLVGGRLRPLPAVLALAAVLVVLVNPLVVMTPGFWLSFAAVLAIGLYLYRHGGQPRWRQLLGVQLWLSLFLLPLVWHFFGGIAWLSLPVNLLMVPLFGLLLPALMLTALLELAGGWAGPLQLLLALVDGLWRALDAVAAWPPAYSLLPAPGLAATLAALAGLLWLLLARGRWRAGGALLLLPLLAGAPGRPEAGTFRAWFWDVGQGQSVLIRTASHDLLYDAGPAWPGGFDAGERIVVPALRAVGVARLDRMLLSHADSDHAGGAGAVARALPVADPRRGCRAGERWSWDGVEFAILHPGAGRWSDNNASCVLRVTSAAGRSLLLTGDIEAVVERRLLEAPLALRADVLSVPHHGSDSSSTPAFLAAVAPRWAVVSAGWRNRWGFPRPAVQARYAAAGIALLNTAEQGAIRLDIGSRPILHAWRAGPPRLWRFAAPES